MTGFLGGSLIGVGQGGAIDTGDIAHSLRFRGGYISKTPSAAPAQQKITFSWWQKRATLGTEQVVFGGVRTGTGYSGDMIRFNTSNQLEVAFDDSANAVGPYATSEVFRDPTSWEHMVLRFDTTQATQADRMRLYRNNRQVTISNGLSLNANLYFVYGSSPYWWGIRSDGSGGVLSAYAFQGYLARCCVVVGQSYGPPSFCYQNTEINEWVTKSQSEVKAVVDTGDSFSSMLDFDDGTSLTTLGYDKSSKGNNWTLNGHSLTAGVNYDWMDDVPFDSFAVMSPIDKASNTTISNGNLLSENTNTLTNSISKASIAFDAGGAAGFNWEVLVNSANNLANAFVGAVPSSVAPTASYTSTGCVSVYSSGEVHKSGVLQGTYLSYTTSDIIKFWVANGELRYSVNGVSANSGNAVATGLSGDYVAADFRASSAAVTCSWVYNFGQYPFATGATYYSAAGGYFRYAPPTGFKALSQRNLVEGSSVTLSGSFTGNAAVDGPAVWLNGSPDTLTINGNAVTFDTHADRLATGFKVRSSSASYNAAGSNTFVATVTSNLKNCFKYNNAKDNT